MKDKRITSAFPMSALMIIITTLYNLLILAMVYHAFQSSIIVLKIISLVFLISPIFFLPLHLVVDEKNLKIWRPIGKVEIRLEDIKSCSFIEDSRSFFDKTIRTFGSGGLYGFLGHFKHNYYGKMRMFVTHTKQCFLIRMKDGQNFVVSSPKRGEIVKFVNSKVE